MATHLEIPRFFEGKAKKVAESYPHLRNFEFKSDPLVYDVDEFSFFCAQSLIAEGWQNAYIEQNIEWLKQNFRGLFLQYSAKTARVVNFESEEVAEFALHKAAKFATGELNWNATKRRFDWKKNNE